MIKKYIMLSLSLVIFSISCGAMQENEQLKGCNEMISVGNSYALYQTGLDGKFIIFVQQNSPLPNEHLIRGKRIAYLKFPLVPAHYQANLYRLLTKKKEPSFTGVDENEYKGLAVRIANKEELDQVLELFRNPKCEEIGFQILSHSDVIKQIENQLNSYSK